MNTRGIVQFGDTVLRARCEKVADFESEGWKDLAGKLLVATRQSGRVGVAAPQIGYPVRAFAAWMGGPGLGELRVFANCRIVNQGGEQRGNEGCLSVAGRWFHITRSERVSLVAQDATGAPFDLELFGLDARAIQHECDHLDGILVVDRAYEQSRTLPRQQRRTIERELAKVSYSPSNTTKQGENNE